MKNTSQKGFAHLALLLLLAVVAVVAFAGYKVVQNRQTDASASSAATPAKVIPEIKNTADLNTVQTSLNDQNIDGNLNPDSLNSDVQNLL